MPINFSDDNLTQLEMEFAVLPDKRAATIDAIAAMIFTNLHMTGLAHPDLPNTAPELKRKEIAKLRLLAITLEAVYGWILISERNEATVATELTHGMNCPALTPTNDDGCTCGLQWRVEIARLKKLIDRDRTGLANALNAVRQVLKGYGWIPAGEWGSYEWQERTEKAFRAEIGRCFDEAEKIALNALKASGDLANEAFNPPDDKKDFAAISKARVAAAELGFDFDELIKGRRCPKCQGLMIHTRLGGYRCNLGCQ